MFCRGGAGRKCGKDSECGASALHEHRWQALRASMLTDAYYMLPARLCIYYVLRPSGPSF